MRRGQPARSGGDAKDGAGRGVTIDAHRGTPQKTAIITGAWLEYQQCFPFVETPRVADFEPETLSDAVIEAMAGQPVLGSMAENGAPVPVLPPRERQKHLYIVGKTGSGKSTFLEHLIERNVRTGVGVVVISPERGFFEEHLVPHIPSYRHDDVIYFAPGDPENTITLNPLAVEPGQDVVRAGEDLFTIFRRAIADTSIGPRMDPIIQNAFAALVGQRDGSGRPMTFFAIKRLMEDEMFREEVLNLDLDSYVVQFWRETYPSYPAGAHLSLVNRLDRFLRPPALRRSLCVPESSFSLRDALTEKRILLLDLSNLSEGSRLLIGQMLLAKLQLELMHRENSGRDPVFLYADEFQTFAGVAEGTWRELLSRGRKFGVALTLAHQYPSQLPRALQDEIMGNVNSLVAFKLGAKDAQVVRRELLHGVLQGEDRLKPIDASEMLELGVGQAMCRYAGGRAVRVQFPAPLSGGDSVPERIIAASRRRYGREQEEDVPRAPEPQQAEYEPDDFLE